MSYIFNGLTHKLETTATFADLANTSFSMAIWLRPDDPTPASTAVPIMVGNQSYTSDRYCAVRLATTGDIGAQAYQSTSSSITTNDASCASATWALGIGHFTLDASHRVTQLDAWMFNGTNEATLRTLAALTKQMSTFNILRIGEGRTGTSEFYGRLAHAAIWTKLLDSSERTSLRTNAPNLVASSDLYVYWPLLADANAHADYGAGTFDLTVTDATLSADDGPSINLGSGGGISGSLINRVREMNANLQKLSGNLA